MRSRRAEASGSRRWSSTSDPDQLDFRLGMIGRRLKRVDRVLLVLSGKGGVGKSVVSAALAGQLAESGMKVGLLDADIYGPSSALLFSASALPKEGRGGLVPPKIGGVKIMSVDLFAAGRPVPLTGAGARQVLLELLALTDWGRLDCLVVDMPPATGDIMQTLTSLGKTETAALVVTLSDRLSTTVSHRALELLRTGHVATVGVLENMQGRHPDSKASNPRKLAKEFGVPFLGALPYDQGVTRAVEAGDIRVLLSTGFAARLRRLSGKLLTD